MKIEAGKTAVVHYELSDADSNSQIETTTKDNPAVFKFGVNQLIPGFEKNLTGLKANDPFDFVIEANDAYGPVDPYAIFDIPLDTCEVEGKID